MKLRVWVWAKARQVCWQLPTSSSYSSSLLSPLHSCRSTFHGSSHPAGGQGLEELLSMPVSLIGTGPISRLFTHLTCATRARWQSLTPCCPSVDNLTPEREQALVIYRHIWLFRIWPALHFAPVPLCLSLSLSLGQFLGPLGSVTRHAQTYASSFPPSSIALPLGLGGQKKTRHFSRPVSRALTLDWALSGLSVVALSRT